MQEEVWCLKYLTAVYNSLSYWVYWSEGKASGKNYVNVSWMLYNPLVKIKPGLQVKWKSEVGFMGDLQLVC